MLSVLVVSLLICTYTWVGYPLVFVRMTQAEKLARDLRSDQRPLIVAGDFNAPAKSLVVRRLFDMGLRNAFAVAGLGCGYTWGHSLRLPFSFLRIDHMVGPE